MEIRKNKGVNKCVFSSSQKMGFKLKYFTYVFLFSILSLTLQATVISFCKDIKVSKTSTQSSSAEEEEESHGNDDSADEEVLYLNHHSFFDSCQNVNPLKWWALNIHYPSSPKTILIPPPKH